MEYTLLVVYAYEKRSRFACDSRHEMHVVIILTYTRIVYCHTKYKTKAQTKRRKIRKKKLYTHLFAIICFHFQVNKHVFSLR